MNSRFFFALVALFFFFAVFSSQYWHSLASKNDFFSFFLNSFDSKVVLGEKACFNVGFESSIPTSVKFTAEVSGKLIYNEILKVDGVKNKEYCFSLNELFEGENTVFLSANERSLFFHVVKDSNAVKKETVSLVSESLKASQSVNWFYAVFGILFIAFFLALVFKFLPESIPKPEKVFVSLIFLSVILIVNFFVLNFFKIVGFLGIFIMLFVELVVFVILFFKPQKSSLERVKPFEAFDFLAPLILIVFTVVFFHFFTSTHLTFFNSFYERSTRIVVENNGLPLKDALSYLGERNFAFIPGYFMLEASLSFLTGLQGNALFALMLAFASLLFVFAVFFLLDALGLKKHFSLAFFLIAANAFVFNFLVFTPRHLVSFSLLLAAFAVLAKFKHWFFSGVILGIASFVQAPLLLFFIPLVFFASRDFEFKQFLKSMIVGFIVFGILFLPNFLKFGLPSFALPEDWGYLLSLPFDFVLIDHALPVMVIIFFVIVDFVFLLEGNRLKFSNFQKKLAFGIVFCFLFEQFVSYRINILTSVLIALFVAEWVSLRKFWQERQDLIIVLVFIVGILLIFLFLPKAVIPQEVFSASFYLKTHSNHSDNVLSDPYFGHSLEYLAERKVLADLWVEYVDVKKLNDSFEFFKTGSLEILRKYNIKFTYSQKDLIFESAFEKHFKGFFEFPALNKVYDDGLIFVHQVPNKLLQD